MTSLRLCVGIIICNPGAFSRSIPDRELRSPSPSATCRRLPGRIQSSTISSQGCLPPADAAMGMSAAQADPPVECFRSSARRCTARDISASPRYLSADLISHIRERHNLAGRPLILPPRVHAETPCSSHLFYHQKHCVHESASRSHVVNEFIYLEASMCILYQYLLRSCNSLLFR